jgi:hypothetical protein
VQLDAFSGALYFFSRSGRVESNLTISTSSPLPITALDVNVPATNVPTDGENIQENDVYQFENEATNLNLQHLANDNMEETSHDFEPITYLAGQADEEHVSYEADEDISIELVVQVEENQRDEECEPPLPVLNTSTKRKRDSDDEEVTPVKVHRTQASSSNHSDGDTSVSESNASADSTQLVSDIDANTQKKKKHKNIRM